MLESATEGGTGASGHGSGRGDRMGLVSLKIDLERAADMLPAYWQSTELIYRKQHRSQALTQRRQSHPSLPIGEREPEHPIPSQALQDALWRMARALGWAPAVQSAA
jgi:hypothetical protein